MQDSELSGTGQGYPSLFTTQLSGGPVRIIRLDIAMSALSSAIHHAGHSDVVAARRDL